MDTWSRGNSKPDAILTGRIHSNPHTKGKPHHFATYLLETCVWGLAHKKKAFLERLPSIRFMGRRTELETKHQGEWFRLPLLLQESYDSSVDLDIRLRLLIEGLRNVHALLTIDQEILVLAAAVRLLVRVRARQFARLLYGDFTAYSYQLTDGKSADPLGLLSDLEDRLTVAAQTIP